MRSLGYGAAFCPLEGAVDDDTVRAYAQAAENADLVIAEVLGPRTLEFNPLDADDAKRKAAVEYGQQQLDLAERIGARCLVNISGSRGEHSHAVSPDNFSEDGKALVVDTVREIIDGVKPTRTFYTIEHVPWMYPYSVDSYLELVDAVDRKQFAIHLDATNLISSALDYYGHVELLRSAFRRWGSLIKSCHAKDFKMAAALTVKIDEVRPGLGDFDYRAFLPEVENLDPDLPVLLEHLPDDDEYTKATEYVRSVADELGVTLR
jgi:sugar phosphate isomerase/epimerase